MPSNLDSSEKWKKIVELAEDTPPKTRARKQKQVDVIALVPKATPIVPKPELVYSIDDELFGAFKRLAWSMDVKVSDLLNEVIWNYVAEAQIRQRAERVSRIRLVEGG